METLFGFLNIDKPKNITSFDVIYKLRKILNIKKIGHTGTLDPLATGVLPIAVGDSTRLIEYLNHDKKYIAKIKFGQTSTTFDEEGDKTEIKQPDFTKENLEKVLNNFQGKIFQTPPIYSAIKINGQKLYNIARKNGEIPNIKKREIEIYYLKLLNFNLPEIEIEVFCSSGTYIRTLADDIGKAMGCGAYLSDLRRIQANNLKIENSIKIENVKAELLINPTEMLDLRHYQLNEEEFKRIKCGNSIEPKQNYNQDEKILTLFNNKIISVSRMENGILFVDKVLNIC